MVVVGADVRGVNATAHWGLGFGGRMGTQILRGGGGTQIAFFHNGASQVANSAEAPAIQLANGLSGQHSATRKRRG